MKWWTTLIATALAIGLTATTCVGQGYMYALSSQGTINGEGSIFRFGIQPNDTPQLVYSFPVEAPGVSPGFVELVVMPDTAVWGTTIYGGQYDLGVIYRYHVPTKQYTVMHHFNGVDGANPYSGLLLAQDGYLYGGTFNGGKGDSGVVYRINPADGTFEKLYDLGDFQLKSIYNRLDQHSSGRIFGTTLIDKRHFSGAIFSFVPGDSALTIEAYFSTINTRFPASGVTIVGDTLYGTTDKGGDEGYGLLYAYDIVNKTLTALLHFDQNTGNRINTPLRYHKGLLYGVAQRGIDKGVIFSFDPASRTHTKVLSFPHDDIDIGTNPAGGVLITPEDKLIGTTNLRAANNLGAIFELDLHTRDVRKLADFDFFTGFEVLATPILLPDGDVLFACRKGSIYEYGTIVRLPYAHGSSKLQLEKKLNVPTKGANPLGSLTLASDGKLYGMCSAGGDLNLGTIFRVDPMTQEVEILFHFDWIRGANPYTSFTQVGDALYAPITGGGGDSLTAPGVGCIISLDLHTMQVRKEAAFPIALRGQAPEGALPVSALILGKDGMLYGTAKFGGKNNRGAIYRFNPQTGELKAVFHFNNNVYQPFGGLTHGDDTWLYGITRNGGAHKKGVIYRYDYSSGQFETVADFGGWNDARKVESTPIYYNGKLYATSQEGGRYRLGNIFQYDLQNNSFTKIVEMDGQSGASPLCGMILGPDTMMYTFTTRGGAYNGGVAWRFHPDSLTAERLWDFDYEFGAIPFYTAPVWVDTNRITYVFPTEKNPLPNRLGLLPNPTRRYAVMTQLASDGHYEVSIYDLRGQQIAKHTQSNNVLDVSQLPTGTYWIVVKSREHRKLYAEMLIRMP